MRATPDPPERGDGRVFSAAWPPANERTFLKVRSMVGTPFPSGNPAADRRAQYADTLAYLGDLDAALEVLQGALELVPGWAAGWFRLGEYFERAGQTDAAAQAWDRAVQADPADPLGAGVKRDLMRARPVAETLPPAFVELLFDQYAPRFERSLRGALDYRGPEAIMEALDATGFRHAALALDLGCGTGLMADVLRHRCDWLGGVDISAGMLAEAQARGQYDWLDKCDIGAMAVGEARYDLIIAADVFVYVGALERIVAWCAGSLQPGGRLAFTVEEGDAPYMLRESRRFAHSEPYLRGLLAEAGFASCDVTPCVLRKDRGAPIRSLVVVASRAPADGRLSREGDSDREVSA